MKQKVWIGLLAALMIVSGVLTGCSAEKAKYSATFMDLFDTVTVVTGYAESESAFHAEEQRIYEELKRLHQLYDIYHEYDGITNICTLNAHQGEQMKVDQAIIDLLLLAKEASEFSGGKTDASMGSVLSIWHEVREEGINNPEKAVLPDEEELREAAKHIGFDKVIIDAEAGTVCITDPETRLDVGSAAKGYAVQKVGETLESGYLITVGGNVYATGPKADGSAWIVGIQDPDGPGYLQKITLKKGAVVTSGDYQRYYTVNGKNYHHIIDPDTLYPSELWRAVTVVVPDSGLGDVLSTTLFLLPLEEGQELLNRFGAEALWINSEGEMFYSPGYRDMLKE